MVRPGRFKAWNQGEIMLILYSLTATINILFKCHSKKGSTNHYSWLIFKFHFILNSRKVDFPVQMLIGIFTFWPLIMNIRSTRHQRSSGGDAVHVPRVLGEHWSRCHPPLCNVVLNHTCLAEDQSFLYIFTFITKYFLKIRHF